MRTTLILLVALAGCASDSNLQKSGYADGVGESSIKGRVCNPETGAWLQGATVYTHVVSNSGELLATPTSTTDELGWWELAEIPGGTYEIYVQYGSTQLDLFEVTLREDEDLVLDEGSCVGGTGQVAAVTGDYDDWETVLPEIGLADYTAIDGDAGGDVEQFLTNSAQMGGYDAIFIPGGVLEEDVFYDTDGSDADGKVGQISANLIAYVEAGGVLFASDWGYDAVEQVWPNKIEFLGDDVTPDAAQQGEPTTISASIKDLELGKALGAEKAKVVFDLDTWPVMTEAGEGVDVYLTGEAPWRNGEETGAEKGVPLLVGFTAGKGHVYFSSFRAESNIDGDGKAILTFLFKDL